MNVEQPSSESSVVSPPLPLSESPLVSEYRDFVANSAEGIWRMDLEVPVSTTLPANEQIAAFYRYGVLTECNAAFVRMYGYDAPSDFVGARLADMMPASESKNVEYLRALVAANYRLSEVESVERDRDGNVRHFANSLVGVVQNGAVVHAWGTQRDITEQRRLEAELEKREGEYAALVENAPDILIRFDEQMRVLYVNRALETQWGLPASALVGRSLFDFSPGFAPLIESAVRQVFASGESTMRVMTDYPTPGMGLVSCEVIYSPEFESDAPGARVKSVVAVIHDATERKRAEDALRRSAEEFQQIADALPQIVWTTRADGGANYHNRRWYEFTGFDEDEDEDNSLRRVLHPDDVAPYLAAWQSSLQIGMPFEMECRLREQGGNTHRWFLARALPVRDAGTNAVSQWFGTCTDVDDQKRALERLRDSEQNLQIALAVAQMGTWEVDVATDVELLSARAARMLTGRVYENPSGGDSEPRFRLPVEEWRNLLQTNEHERVFDMFGAAIRGEAEYRIEYRVRWPDTNTIRWIASQGVVLRDAVTGTATRVVGVCQDITERKQNENALRMTADELRRFADIFHHTNQAIVVGSEDVRTLEMLNPMFARMHGYEVDELLGQPIANVFAPEAWEEARTHMRQSMETGHSAWESVHVRKDGSRFPVWIDSVAVRNEASGRVRYRISTVTDISKRKAADLALRDSEERFRLITQNARELISILNTSGQYVYASPSYKTVLGFDPAEIVGKTVPDFVPTEDLAELAAWDNVAVPFTFRHRCADGDLIFMEGTSYPITLAGVAHFVGVARDISKRKAAEERLAQSNHRLQIATGTARLGIFEWNATTDAALWENEQMFHIFGLNVGETPPARPEYHSKFILAEDLHFLEDARRRSIRANEPMRVTYRIRRKNDGVIRRIEHTGAFELDEAGAPLRFVGVCQDITEREAATEAMRESEGRFRAMADNIPQLAWMADETGGIFWYNRRWFEYTGTTLETMRGWGWQSVHSPDHVERVTRTFREAVATGTAWEETFPLRRDDGSYRWFLSRAQPIREEGNDGKIVRWFGTNTDITEQRERERDQTFLANLGEMMRFERDPDALLWRIVCAVGEHLGVSRCMFADVDAEADTATIARDYCAPESACKSIVGVWPLAPWGASVLMDLDNGRSVVNRDFITDGRTAGDHKTIYKEAGIRANVAVPLHRNGTWVGVFSVQMADVPRDWTEREVTLLETVAERAWLSLENVRLQEANEQAAQQQRRFVREMIFAMTEGKLRLCASSEDLPQPLLVAVDESVELTAPTLRLLRRLSNRACAEAGLPLERAHDLETAIGEAAMNAVVHAGRGEGRIYLDTNRGVVQVWVRDEGSGITEDAIHKATLERGYSSTGTLGHGFWMMLQTADRVYLLTGPQGTTVVVEQERVAPQPIWLKDK